MASDKILIVEDEKDVMELIRYNLNRDGYGTDTALTGQQALDKAIDNKPDLILLDLMLPEIDGLEVCYNLKENVMTEAIPVVMLTAKGTEADIAKGLEMGADDYITKPFSPRILIERIKAVLRRNDLVVEQDKTMVRIDDLEIDLVLHRVKLKDKLIDLTSKEFALLKFLATRPGWVFTQYQTVDAVDVSDYPVTDCPIDAHVVGLREKLGTAGKYIETVRGGGYRYYGK